MSCSRVSRALFLRGLSALRAAILDAAVIAMAHSSSSDSGTIQCPRISATASSDSSSSSFDLTSCEQISPSARTTERRSGIWSLTISPMSSLVSMGILSLDAILPSDRAMVSTARGLQITTQPVGQHSGLSEHVAAQRFMSVIEYI